MPMPEGSLPASVAFGYCGHAVAGGVRIATLGRLSATIGCDRVDMAGRQSALARPEGVQTHRAVRARDNWSWWPPLGRGRRGSGRSELPT
jgi:hypothetical protein